MKKFLSIIFVIVFSSFCMFSCADKGDNKAYTSIEYYNSASDIIPAIINGKVQYAVLPEPAVSSARNNKSSGIVSVLDLQEIYGDGEKVGYPQAVLVAKQTVLEDKYFLQSFISAIKSNESYITQIENIPTAVNSINAILEKKGLQPSLNASSTTENVIDNLNISFSWALDEKQDIINYLNGFRSLESQSVGSVVDDFFVGEEILEGDSNSGKLDVEYKVYVPDGAPALSIAKLITQNMNFNRIVTYNVVTSSTIGQDILQKADIGILPVNAASKLFGDTAKGFVMLGVVTHGNLFLVSRNEMTKIDDVIDKKVALAGMGNFMDLTYRLILKNYNILVK